MNVTYDRKTNTLIVQMKPGSIAESDEEKPGVILDIDEQGKRLGFETLDALWQIDDAIRVDFKVTIRTRMTLLYR